LKRDELRSHRLNLELLPMARRGATEEQLRSRIRRWGVTKPTEDKYMKDLREYLNR